MSEQPKKPAWVERMGKTLDELEALANLRGIPDDLLSPKQRQTKACYSGIRCPRCGVLVAPFYPQAILCGDCYSEFREMDRPQTECMWYGDMLQQIHDNQAAHKAKQKA
jgi:hypothetical protein